MLTFLDLKLACLCPKLLSKDKKAINNRELGFTCRFVCKLRKQEQNNGSSSVQDGRTSLQRYEILR